MLLLYSLASRYRGKQQVSSINLTHSAKGLIEHLLNFQTCNVSYVYNLNKHFFNDLNTKLLHSWIFQMRFIVDIITTAISEEIYTLRFTNS